MGTILLVRVAHRRGQLPKASDAGRPSGHEGVCPTVPFSSSLRQLSPRGRDFVRDQSAFGFGFGQRRRLLSLRLGVSRRRERTFGETTSPRLRTSPPVVRHSGRSPGKLFGAFCPKEPSCRSARTRCRAQAEVRGARTDCDRSELAQLFTQSFAGSGGGAQI